MKLSKVCEVCFGEYSVTRKTLVLWCCSKLLCEACVENSSSFSKCPWDRRRWTSRTLKSKCLAVTPSDLLEQVLTLEADDTIPEQQVHHLGEGILRAEYEDQIFKRKTNAQREQEEADMKLALSLSGAEAPTSDSQTLISSSSSSIIRSGPELRSALGTPRRCNSSIRIDINAAP